MYIGRTQKETTVFAAVTVIAYFNSFTPTKLKGRGKEQYTEITFNGSGDRDTAKILKVDITTVICNAHTDLALIC
ncbi:hypothetical protein KGP20_02015 [Enterobacter asburiae]|nr:hypothetical protein KGP20_02015 [Enterobacter asburiae]UAN34036.1 hypothetical protein KGP22_18565 [Enterobacter sp. JBIWA005]